jgi:predicted TPR repeat methyltransferase
MSGTRSAAHFARLYQHSNDPWAFETSDYERAKYAKTIDALGNRHFASGLEVGCSIGVLTRMLAGHCDRLLGIDIVEAPLVQARARCQDRPAVAFQRMTVPQSWPADRFDLIVLSEVLYYFAADDIDRVAHRVANSLAGGGLVVLVHWTGPLDDPTSGDQASERFIDGFRGRFQGHFRGTAILHERTELYRLDVLRAGGDGGFGA